MHPEKPVAASITTMTTIAKNDAVIRLHLPSNLKKAIEEAAALAGQTVSDFAISSLMQSARTLKQEQVVTVLSKRHRDIFMRLLDRTDAKPNKALAAAARRYNKSSAG